MLEQFIFLLLGLIGLCVGADFLIKGIKNIAEHFGISQFFIGLALVSIGTSIPEIGVSIAGGLDRLVGIETSGLVVGDAIGSALSQISLLFGILAFLVPLTLKRKEILTHGSFLVAAILLVFGLGIDGYLSVIDGFILLGVYAFYLLYLWTSYPLKHRGRPIAIHLVSDLIYVAIGFVLVLFTANIVVDSGVFIASVFGISQSLIGIFLIGIGTGLPELSIALASFRHKTMAISMGDLIGSNICDLLLSLGIGTVISGFIVDPVHLWFDLPVLLLFSGIVIFFFYSGRRISKREGSILIGLFILYALVKFFVTG